jgi:hypothetical protein
VRAAWRFARWLVRLEIGIWRSLWLWIRRRKSGVRPGVEPVSYAKEITPVLAVFVVLSLVELPVVHVLIPWDSVRLVVLVLSVWGLLWMVGYLASVRVFPHLLSPHGLRVRFGTHVDIEVPWSAVEGVSARRGSVPTGGSVVVEDGAVSVPVMKQTRVTVVLREATRLSLPDGEREVGEVRFYVDKPAPFVARARELLAPA